MLETEEQEKILDAQREILEAKTPEERFERLMKYSLQTFGDVYGELRKMRELMPWKPWMARWLGPSIIGTIIVAAVFVLALNDRTNSVVAGQVSQDSAIVATRAETDRKCADLDAKLDPLGNAVAEANASLRILLRSRGLSMPDSEDIRAARRRLNIVEDTTLTVDTTAHVGRGR